MSQVHLNTKIKLLTDSTINKIAAGEVVERPASVLKELVENSIDAGSSKIDILLERGGKNLIIVTDDGIGMSKAELELAIQRHSTSKLDEDDLLNINTFGFRGEALPSIASVSKMIITSKARGSKSAFQIQSVGHNDQKITPTISNEGCNIQIRDLFFATPARLKFLRTDITEFNACLDIIKKIAIAHPYITFNLSHNEKQIFKVKKQSGDLLEATKNRITEILGTDFINNASSIQLDRPELNACGYTSIPTFNKASTSDQFLFINSRPVKDKILSMALKVAYQDYLSKDRHPITVLFLNIDHQLIDVNVHPTKIEVRFHNPNLIKNIIISAIKDALSKINHRVSTTNSDAMINLFKSKALPQQNYIKNLNVKNTASNFLSSVSDVETNSYNAQCKSQPTLQQKLINTIPFAKVEQTELHQKSNMQNNELSKHVLSQKHEISTTVNLSDSISNIKKFPLGAAKAQIYNTYIISQTDNSIVIVDQHAAHERIGYEKIKQLIEQNGLIKQRLLIPEVVEFQDAKRAYILAEQQANLSKLGLTLEKFGNNSIIVSTIPSILGDINVKTLINDLSDHLLDIGANFALIQLIEHVTETYACHYSIRAGRTLSIAEMNSLLRQMETTPFSGQCNHGRPTYIELELKDIEKLFGRS